MISSPCRRDIGKSINKDQKFFKVGFEFRVRFRKFALDVGNFVQFKSIDVAKLMAEAEKV